MNKEYRTYERRRLVVEDGYLSGEEAAHVEVKSSREGNANPSSILGQNCHFLSHLNMEPVWRGSFSIFNGIGTVKGLVAHVSSKACTKVSAVARSMPASLCGEVLHKHDLWPKGFDKSPPTGCDIALYFSPENERDEKLYDSLLDDLIDQNYALKAVVGRTELLVFTSRELPVEHWRFKKKYYLWGLFRIKKASSPYQADDHLHQKHVSTKCTEHLLSATDVGAGEESNLEKASDTCSPMSPLSSSGETEDVDETPMNIDTPESFGRNTNFTSDGSAEVRAPVDTSYNEKDITIRGVTMEKGPEVVSEKESQFPENISGAKEMFSGNTNTISNTVGAIFHEYIGTTMHKASMNKDVELDQSDPLIEVQKEFEQPTRGQIVNEGLAEMENCRTIVDVSTERCALSRANYHEKDETSVPVEKDHEGINKRGSDRDFPWNIAINADPMQDGLSIRNVDAIGKRLAAIPPQEINQAIDEASINKVDQQVPVVLSIERREQTAMIVFQSLHNSRFSEGLVGRGPQAGMVESSPETTVPSSFSSSLPSAQDVQETTNVTQHQGADQGTMLHRNREVNEASSNQFGSQSIGTSMYNMADAFHEMDPDKTDSADNSVTRVGPYRVKSDVAPILQTIIDKHGDIAQDCQLRNVSMRSRVLEGLCMELQKLQSFTSTNFRSHHVESLDSAITDAEHAGLKVKWLRCWHNQLSRFLDRIQQYKSFKDDFTKSKEIANSKKRTLDTKRADMRKIQSDIELLQSQLASSEAEMESLDSSMINYQSKCERFFGKSLAEGLQ